MGAFLEQYGIAIFVLVIVGIMVLMASGVGSTVEGLITQEIKRFTDKSVSENKKVVEGQNQITYAMLDKPEIVSGGNDVMFRSEADLAKFKEIKIDGNVVDSNNYTTYNGSTGVQLKKEFLKTLDNGNHNIEIVSTDGKATTSFTVDKTKVITFKIHNTTYTATEGMSWIDWINTYRISGGNNGIVYTGASLWPDDSKRDTIYIFFDNSYTDLRYNENTQKATTEIIDGAIYNTGDNEPV